MEQIYYLGTILTAIIFLPTKKEKKIITNNNKCVIISVYYYFFILEIISLYISNSFLPVELKKFARLRAGYYKVFPFKREGLVT